MTRAILFGALSAVLLASEARAACCRVVKTDVESPPVTLRVCEPGPDRSCGAVLFSGTLALGEGQDVCTQADTMLYEELDPDLGSYRAPVEARCDGRDVEI